MTHKPKGAVQWTRTVNLKVPPQSWGWGRGRDVGDEYLHDFAGSEVLEHSVGRAVACSENPASI